MEYITITEFAERAGVTPQAVYKRLKTDLEQFLKVENGTKLLNEEALNLFAVKQQSKQSQYVKELEELIEQLKVEKAELQTRLTENNEKLLQILERQSTQLENYQLLLAQNQQLQQSLLQLNSTVEEVENQEVKVETTTSKPSFLKRLFSKSK